MKWLDSLIAWLFPTIIVDGTPWKGLWVEQERASFVAVSKFFFPMLGLGYLAHYFFYDKPNQLEPIESWLMFRIWMFTFSLLTAGFYLTKFREKNWYKLPAILMCWTMCQTQAVVAHIHGLESWIFCYILVVLSVLALRMSALKSLLFAAITMVTQTMVLSSAGVSSSYIFTGSVVAIIVTLVVRTPYMSEVRNFLLSQQNIEAQKKIIELNIDFSERIRSFIPKVISNRIDQYIEEKRMSVLEASIEVLSPKKKDVACLFTDIRGFTQSSKNLEQFIRDSVIPEVKTCSNEIERLGGIPRKIGDLIFAYFDESSRTKNLVNATLAGMEVARVNQDMNATSSSVTIRRYVLISSGEAIVGNLGGLDSSIEITALGRPVNFLSRVDELTKSKAVREQIETGDLLLCEQSMELLGQVVDLDYKKLEFSELGVSIRDFPEECALYAIPPSDKNYRKLNEVTSTSGYRNNRSTGGASEVAA